jgi:hypothetical protein
MQPEGSFPHSQVPTTCPYPEPSGSSPHAHIKLPEVLSLILSSHLHLGLPSGLHPSGYLTKTLYVSLLSVIYATCPAHLTFLDLITRTIFGEQYRSLSSSICSYRHSRYLVTLRPKYSSQLPFLKHCLRPSLNLSDQVSHPYEITGKPAVAHYLIHWDLQPPEQTTCTHPPTHTHTHTHTHTSQYYPRRSALPKRLNTFT